MHKIKFSKIYSNNERNLNFNHLTLSVISMLMFSQPEAFSMSKPEDIHDAVSKTYGKYAVTEPTQCCCGAKKYAKSLGYTEEDLTGADPSVGALSCGNPIGIADLKPGEIVLDLGCGTGFDCRLAAKKVGISGKVIGVDMTPAMLEKATQITDAEKFPQIAFILSRIEDISGKFEKNSFDAVISNCVFNLSPEKPRVLSGVFDVLKPGGRLIFSDPVALKPIPEATRKDLASFTSCMANATPIEELAEMLTKIGFHGIRIEVKDDSSSYVSRWTPESQWAADQNPKDYVATASIWAYK